MILLSWDWLILCKTMDTWKSPTFPTLIRCCLMASPVTSLAGGLWTVSRHSYMFRFTYLWAFNKLIPTLPLHSLSPTDGGSIPSILQEAPIDVVEHKVCSQSNWWGSNALKTMVCAGGDGIISGCQVQLMNSEISLSKYQTKNLNIFLLLLVFKDSPLAPLTIVWVLNLVIQNAVLIPIILRPWSYKFNKVCGFFYIFPVI